ncbi:rab-GTPase-TBC domain-containing protein [Sporodiniella umbellata]|nr:rab-GTPase-TBC domain-containing protein [Sporodiniella umbellata]
MSIVTPLEGFQETLLAQMEQLNRANQNDPKSKRQSIRYTLMMDNSKDNYNWDFWAGVMCDYQQLNKISKELTIHVRQGIPPSIRGMTWQLITKAKEDGALLLQYRHLLTRTSAYDKMIQRDLARTFPDHAFFKDPEGQGQSGLYRVIRAFSLYDTNVGYCQGLGFIVGPLLLNMPEEEAFCVLIKLMNSYGLRSHFTPEMEGLQLRLYQFDMLVKEHVPRVSRHFEQQGISSTMYASQWFMTLFAYKFPMHLVFRVYDVLLTEGLGSVFQFALALLKRNEGQLLGLEFERLLDFLKNGLFEAYGEDDRRFVKDACALVVPMARLLQLEKEHQMRLEKEAREARQMESLQQIRQTFEAQAQGGQQRLQVLRQEHSDLEAQLQAADHQRHILEAEKQELERVKRQQEVELISLPTKIESQYQSRIEALCLENATLTQKHSHLEDQLQTAEMTLIDIKMRYAQSENDKESLHKRMFELKRLMESA